MIKNLTLVIFIFISNTILAQGWIKTYEDLFNGRSGHSVHQTLDGGYITAGTINFEDIAQIFLLKTDELGNEQWYQTYDDFYNVEHLQITSDGGFIIVGWTLQLGIEGSYDIYILKTDEFGNQQWYQTFSTINTDWARDIQQTSDGGYIVCGGYPTNFNGHEAWLIKTDSNGNEIWSKIFGGNENDAANSVKQTSDNGFIIAGSTRSFDNVEDSDVWLFKIDENGDELWSKTFGNPGTDESALNMQFTSDGGYIIFGEVDSPENEKELLLIKLDSEANEQWTKTYGGTEKEFAEQVQQTSDGGYIMIGSTFSFSTNPQFNDNNCYLIKVDEQGNEQWSKTNFFGSKIDKGNSVQQTLDGGFILTGNTDISTSDFNEELFLIKTNDNGDITSTIELAIPDLNKKLIKSVNIQGQEINQQANSPVIEIYNDGTVSKKIIIE